MNSSEADLLELILPLSQLRVYTKTDDSDLIEDDELILLRASAFEAYYKYTGKSAAKCEKIQELVKLKYDGCHIPDQTVKVSQPIQDNYVMLQIPSFPLLRLPSLSNTNTFKFHAKNQRCNIFNTEKYIEAKVMYNPVLYENDGVLSANAILGIIRLINWYLNNTVNNDKSNKINDPIIESGAASLWSL